ncbi:hypothetical protein SAMN04488498_1648 [Mesorhizobium albiziae]|uniref:Uncharacterized protein n=1 Tax=Neomesorhizobium albiziae TaxID=335020 RepID=A0A1I4FXK6_9HYPH|nr:hypothetical protein SAMN04488498_1648 [Mesorhizobium albiziae]
MHPQRFSLSKPTLGRQPEQSHHRAAVARSIPSSRITRTRFEFSITGRTRWPTSCRTQAGAKTTRVSQAPPSLLPSVVEIRMCCNVFVTREQRDLPSAKRFFRKALERHGRPDRVVIDGSQTNREAIVSCDTTNRLQDRSRGRLKPIRIRRSQPDRHRNGPHDAQATGEVRLRSESVPGRAVRNPRRLLSERKGNALWCAKAVPGVRCTYGSHGQPAISARDLLHQGKQILTL